MEKQIKAVLTAHEISYRKSHELSYLAGLIEEHKIDVPNALGQANTLTDWAVEFRYEGEEPPTLDRDAALSLVVQLRKWAEAQVAAIADKRKAEPGQAPATRPERGQSPTRLPESALPHQHPG